MLRRSNGGILESGSDGCQQAQDGRCDTAPRTPCVRARRVPERLWSLWNPRGPARDEDVKAGRRLETEVGFGFGAGSARETPDYSSSPDAACLRPDACGPPGGGVVAARSSPSCISCQIERFRSVISRIIDNGSLPIIVFI